MFSIDWTGGTLSTLQRFADERKKSVHEGGQPSTSTITFQDVLEKKIGLHCFKHFAMKTFQEENLMFWIVRVQS